jgi:hypothetical protein
VMTFADGRTYTGEWQHGEVYRRKFITTSRSTPAQRVAANWAMCSASEGSETSSNVDMGSVTSGVSKMSLGSYEGGGIEEKEEKELARSTALLASKQALASGLRVLPEQAAADKGQVYMFGDALWWNGDQVGGGGGGAKTKATSQPLPNEFTDDQLKAKIGECLFTDDQLKAKIDECLFTDDADPNWTGDAIKAVNEAFEHHDYSADGKGWGCRTKRDIFASELCPWSSPSSLAISRRSVRRTTSTASPTA